MGRPRPLPPSVRLVGTFALLTTATLLVVAGLAIQLTRGYLARNLDRRIAAVASSFERGPAARVARAEDLEPEARRWLEEQAFPADLVAAVRTDDGQVLLGSGALDLRKVPGGLDLLVSRASGWWELEGPRGQVRALTVPLVREGQPAGTLVVAGSRAEVEATLRALASGIFSASGVGLAFAAVLAFVGVRRTLGPLSRMAREVETIHATGDLSIRVGGRGPADEVGRLAGAFDRMLGRLEEAFRSQRRFLSDASHELRTPLTVVRGQLELLDREIRSAEGRRSVALAVEELDRMGRIVEDLLLLARLEEGMPLRAEPVEVDLVVGEALLRGMLLSPREAAVEVEPELQAHADPERLLQVLTNLVSNAVRHGGQSCRIAVTARRRGDRVVVEVADDGPGIPPEEMPHVFDRLYRGSQARAESPGGAGLGLAIAASLVRAMGGEIGVRSEPGAGTTFTVEVPAHGSGARDELSRR